MDGQIENGPGGSCGVVGAPRHETIHSMLRRLRNWDYRQRAIYQITITLANRASQALGRLEVTGPTPETIAAQVVPSELGEIVLQCWAEIPAQWPGVSLIGTQVMPDHFHGIIFIERPQVKPLGNIIGSFKSKSSSRVGRFLAARGQAQNQAARGQARNQIACGQAQDLGGHGAGFCATPRAASLWSPGYQDTILFREGQLANMKRYLADNPRRLAIKRLFPNLFRVAGELAVPLSLPGGSPARRCWQACRWSRCSTRAFRSCRNPVVATSTPAPPVAC